MLKRLDQVTNNNSIFVWQLVNDSTKTANNIPNQYLLNNFIAVAEADKSELEAIEEVFCKNRTDPLKIGSVMSNIGYGEAASGISAITKVSQFIILVK